MSNHLAIATVTKAIDSLLSEPVDAAVSGAKVLHDRPDKADSAKANVNVYLYEVSRHRGLANAELPVRRPDGTLAQRPLMALNLRYLMTFYGDDSRLEPQRLMGATLSALHETPVLTQKHIVATLAAEAASDPSHPLMGSDLASQDELVRLAPLSLDVDAMSKLWSIFFQTPYSLSVALEASLVLIEGTLTPRPALPVRERGLFILPSTGARIDAVEDSAGPHAPVTAASTLHIDGRGFAGSSRVLLGALTVAPDTASPGRLVVALSGHAADLRAGVVPLQVVQPAIDASGTPMGFGLESNVVPVLLRPTVTIPSDPAAAASSAKVFLDVAPAVREGQRVVLMLFGARAFRFDAGPAASDATRLELAIADVPAGDYLVQLVVDGVRSPLEPGSGGGWSGPEVAIP